MIFNTAHQCLPRRRFATVELRVVTAFVASLFLCLSVALPAMGSQGSWIEICGEHGVEVVQVVSESDLGAPSSPDCAHCTTCLFSGPDTKALSVSVPDSTHIKPQTSPFISAAIFAQPIQRMDGVLSRGPPLKGIKRMTPSHTKRCISGAGSGSV